MKKTDSLILVFGIFIPFLTLLVEGFLGICRMAFFNPIPTPLHTLMVLSVPVINFFVLNRTRRADFQPGKLDFLLICSVIATSAVYTLAMLPVMPAGLACIFWFGVGLCAFAPLFSLISGLLLLRRLFHMSASSTNWSKQSVFSAGGLCIMFCTIAGVLWSFMGESGGGWMYHP